MAETIYTIKSSTLEAIGDAIREKTGTTDKITPEDMATAVSEIQSGGGDDRFLNFIEGNLTELTYDDITTIGAQAFYGNQTITKVDLPNLIDVGSECFATAKIASLIAPKLEQVNGKSVFYNCNSLTHVELPNLIMSDVSSQRGFRLFGYCANLTTISLPKLKKTPEYCFASCSKLISVNLPSVEEICVGSFSSCSSLVSIRLPKATKMIYKTSLEPVFSCSTLEDLYIPMVDQLYANCCKNCYKLTHLDLFVAKRFGSKAFGNNYSFKALILRKEDSLCTLDNADAFDKCYHFHGTVNATYNPDGLKDGYIYVPRALIEDYKVATNWTTFADQFRALEDYTVDGTTTGAMDWDKINGTTN